MKKTVLLIILISLFFTSTFFSQTNEPIRVGVFADMTGQTSSYGLATLNGIKLAVKEINASGGINGREILLIGENNQGSPKQTKTVVSKLINEDKVIALLGDVASSNSLAAAPIAQAAKIPMITPASTHPKVTEVGDFIFRTCFLDPLQGEAMAKFAFNQLKLRRVAILSHTSSDYSKNLETNFEENFTKLGGKVISKQNYDLYIDSDFKGQLLKIRRLKPDAIYLPGYYGQIGTIAKQARQLKMLMPLLGGDGWDSPEIWKLGGNALNNSYITNHFAVDDPAKEVQSFAVRYKAEFNAKPDSLAALAYDTVYVLADAIRRAKSTEGENLRDAIAATKDFNGVTGKILQLDNNRNAVKSVVIQKLDPKTNEFIYRSTIQP
jgi:branched-chain amino acid transport system substrate-binding protein